MSHLKLLNLTLFFFTGFLLMPILAQGKTLSFEDQAWEINAEAASYAPHVAIRNDFDLYKMVKAEIFNTKPTDTTPMFSPSAVNVISALALDIGQPTREPKITIKNGRATNFPGPNQSSWD